VICEPLCSADAFINGAFERLWDQVGMVYMHLNSLYPDAIKSVI
jgi:hypothetical protein